MSDNWSMGSLARQDDYDPFPHRANGRGLLANAMYEAIDPAEGDFYRSSMYNTARSAEGIRQYADDSPASAPTQDSYDPFGAEKFVNPAVVPLAKYIANIPRRAMENSQNALDTGNYDPGPTLDAAGLAMTGGIGGTGPGGFALGTGPVRVPPHSAPIARPAILPPAEPSMDQINAIKAAAVGYGRKGWPTAEREVFKTTPEAYAETTALVPQASIEHRLPGPLPGEALPNKGRADIIVANRDAIAARIAERLNPMVKAGDERLKFYHTGPVIRGLEQYGGLDTAGANTFMRDWAGQGAATSRGRRRRRTCVIPAT